jgi:hypothetical protein
MSGIIKTGAVVSCFFSSWKLALHLADHSNFLSFPSNSVIGLEILENPLMNLLYYPASPKKLFISETLMGVFKLKTSSIFLGSMDIPPSKMTLPRKGTSFNQN